MSFTRIGANTAVLQSRQPIVIAVLGLVGLFGLTGTFSASRPSESEMGSDNSEGHRIYVDHCARCHGEDGTGNGSEAHWFTIPPGDLTAGQYKFRSTPSGAPPMPEDIYRTLTEGLRGTGMLPQLHLASDQRWALTRYLLALMPLPMQNQSSEPIHIPEPPSVTDELIDQGRELYVEVGCVQCHGSNGTGLGATTQDLRDYKDRPVLATDLTLTPRKQSNTPKDLYRLLITGINGTPMPAYDGVLPPEQLWALVYYVDGLAVILMPTADIPAGLGMMHMGMMRNMHRRMGFVGEESIAMMVDMPAARAWMMERRMSRRRP